MMYGEVLSAAPAAAYYDENKWQNIYKKYRERSSKVAHLVAIIGRNLCAHRTANMNVHSTETTNICGSFDLGHALSAVNTTYSAWSL